MHLELQAVALCSILVVGTVGVLLPLKVHGEPTLLALCNLFSAGVLLAAALVHLGPDAAEGVATALPDLDFPLAGCLAGTAFLVLHVLHEVMQDGQSSAHNHVNHTDHASHTDHAKRKMAHTRVGAETLALDSEGGPEVPLLTNGKASTMASRTVDIPADAGCDGTLIVLLTTPRASLASTLCFMLSLGFHSVLEGLALGTNTTGATALFVTILLHKGFAVFSFGSVLHRVKARRGVKVFAAVLVIISTPVGIGAGMLWNPDHDSAATAILQALAAGTFLYIALEEVRLDVFPPEESGWGYGLSLQVL